MPNGIDTLFRRLEQFLGRNTIRMLALSLEETHLGASHGEVFPLQLDFSPFTKWKLDEAVDRGWQAPGSGETDQDLEHPRG